MATDGVASGVMNAVSAPVATRTSGPMGFAPMAVQVRMAMGANILSTAQFIMNCVSTNGTRKNTRPIR